MLINKKLFITMSVAIFFLMAQTASAFSISPLKYTTTMAGGDQQDLIVVVKNDSDKDKIFKKVVIGIKQDANGRPIFQNNIDIAESWVKIKNEKETIKANKSKDFIFEILIPKNTPPGAHYLGLAIEEEGGESVSPRLATILVLQVAGTATESVRLENFFSIKKYFFDKNWFYFFDIKNNGNIGVDLKGEINILSVSNKLVFSSPINLGNKLFAQTNRSARTVIPISFLNQMIWPGFYHVQMVIHYGLTNQQIVGSDIFWYLPIWFLVSVVVLLLAVVILIIKIIRHSNGFKKHEKLD